MFNNMGYLRRPKHVAGRSRKPDGRCRRHTKHQQPPGVCSICLREKLSQLAIGVSSSRSSSSYRGGDYSSGSSSSSLSPYDSSSSCSSLSSPVHRGYGIERGYGLFGGKDVLLVKSKSIHLVPKRRDKEGSSGERPNKGKGGFWSKLIPAGGRKTGDGSGEALQAKNSKILKNSW